MRIGGRALAWLGLGVALIAGLGAVMQAQAIETPGYGLEMRDGDVEIRRYPRMVAAETTRAGDRQAAVGAAFPPLARYIFAEDRPGEKIAMTAPVLQSRGTRDWAVRFLMPAGREVADLPAPAAGVRLVEAPAMRVAAIRFGGRWTDANFADAEARLRAWMAAHNLEAAGPPIYAYYDPPFKPWFLRRNEVLVELAD